MMCYPMILQLASSQQTCRKDILPIDPSHLYLSGERYRVTTISGNGVNSGKAGGSETFVPYHQLASKETHNDSPLDRL